MSDLAVPIIRHPDPDKSRPVVVSIPHFGTEAIPDIRPEDYSVPEFVHLPWGYADTFAADVYGRAHDHGATVVATPYSRLFVDVNRRRDDFACDDGVVISARGVFRTHTRRGKPIFAKPMAEARAEHILAAYYDPYHEGLGSVIEDMRNRHDRLLLLDSHTASPDRIGKHEVVIGTRGGVTADRTIVERIRDLVAAAGVDVHEDVPGYAGGHTVRRYGEKPAAGRARRSDRDQCGSAHDDTARRAGAEDDPRRAARQARGEHRADAALRRGDREGNVRIERHLAWTGYPATP